MLLFLPTSCLRRQMPAVHVESGHWLRRLALMPPLSDALIMHILLTVVTYLACTEESQRVYQSNAGLVLGFSTSVKGDRHCLTRPIDSYDPQGLMPAGGRFAASRSHAARFKRAAAMGPPVSIGRVPPRE
ncbi:hypothetical protein BU26DRAFT_206556 [Trematosphaeria pertusa]|uniref:Uncharacterized protein n=1 Tax=Trematosphaeria pertusa TaxID=390896 RepID=A0A6A6HRN5_9PLEO|nr:uncharacterized protein BU26DRAFT_206556 [Trematosphaeria pertusa]KAF2240492.1 hypothetical protein BU26DRAFT_206556 [Trematosphaeria pertusa]